MVIEALLAKKILSKDKQRTTGVSPWVNAEGEWSGACSSRCHGRESVGIHFTFFYYLMASVDLFFLQIHLDPARPVSA